MPRLDAFVKTLVARSGKEIVFRTGMGAVMNGPEGEAVLVRQPLSSQQIAGAFAEVVPEAQAAGFPRTGMTTFDYQSPDGPVTVKFDQSRDGSVLAVVALRAPAAPGGTGATPEPRPAATPASGTAAPPAAAVSPGAARRASLERGVRLPEAPREAIHALLELVLREKASDLHLASTRPPALRVDGDIVPLQGMEPLDPDRLGELIFAIAPPANRREWEERHDTDFAYEVPGARFRVNVFRDRFGIGAVMRQIPAEVVSAEALGLPASILELCFLNKGLVLVTGPTGSGKSTTLAAMIDHVNRSRDDHVITIEDPIEFVHENRRCLVNQREVGTHTDSFKAALRAALREDPDVVLVGELRDLETIAIAIETAETGHLVFGTLHTNTAPSTVDRIIDQFPTDRQAQIRTMLSESLKGVVSQVLCKKIGGGRVAAMEVLLVTSSVANLIREGKTFQIPSVMQTSRGAGMATMTDALLDLVKRKLVEPREAWMKAPHKGDMKQALERAGFKLEGEG